MRGSVRELGSGSEKNLSQSAPAANTLNQLPAQQIPGAGPLGSPAEPVGAGREIVQAARRDAERILADARELIDAERRKAREQGFEEGRAEAVSLILEIIESQRNTFQGREEEILDLVFAVSEEVIGTALKIQPESIVSRIDRAIKNSSQSAVVTVVVNPEDAAFVRENIQELNALLPIGTEVRLREDETLAHGNAKLETDICVVESSVSAHLAALRAHFLGKAETQLKPANNKQPLAKSIEIKRS